jgi:hypothetical protein
LALEKRFGTYKDSYHHLPALLETIQSRNPSTIIDIEDYINEKGQRVLKRKGNIDIFAMEVTLQYSPSLALRQRIIKTQNDII